MSGDLGEVSDMSPEKITQTEELSYFMNVCRRFCSGDSLEFVRTWFDAFLCEAETEVRDVGAAENTFFEINLDSMSNEAVQQGVDLLKMLFMSARMCQQVVDIHDDVGQAGDDGLHEALEAGRAA